MRQASPTDWVADIRRLVAQDSRLLVVCRTTATVRAVYRELAETVESGSRKAWLGLQVTTLRGLVAAAAPQDLAAAGAATSADEDDEDAVAREDDSGQPITRAVVDLPLPDGHPWKAKLEERPGLRALLREHLERIYWHEAAGFPLDGLRPELRSLVATRWGEPDDLDGLGRLLASRDLPGLHLPERRVAVGFGAAPFSFLGQVGPVERAILSALGCDVLDALDPRSIELPALPAIRVRDTAAEARAVAFEAAKGGSVLVLVSDAASEGRIRASLQRNGIAPASDAAAPLGHHSLAAVLDLLIPVFESNGGAAIDARSLLRVLTDPVLSKTAPRSATVPEAGEDEPRCTLRHVRELIGECRRVRATLADWHNAAEAIAQEWAQELRTTAPSDDEVSRQEAAWRRLVSARVVVAKISVLAQHATGGRLGDLGRCVQTLGLSAAYDEKGNWQGDRVGWAIVRALRDDGFKLATTEALAEALAGAVASGRVDEGVVILPYGSYDGRCCERLVLTGVHDKGLAKAPAPDPFLADNDRRVLGLPTARECIEERLAIARWAASRATAALAIVSDADASSRRVTPPVHLRLVYPKDTEHPSANDSYGLGLELPEKRDRTAFDVRPAKSGRERGETKAGDGTCQQIDVEWARHGSALDAPFAFAPLPSDAPLASFLARDLERFPPDLLPWLGHIALRNEERNGLPEGFVLTASKLRAFTQCLYRAYCQSVLRLKPIEDVEEDLDAREVGTAMHVALEQAFAPEGKGKNKRYKKLLVPSSKVEQTREKLVASLCAALDASIKQVVEDAGLDHGSSPALASAREGLLQRWKTHLEGYAERRIHSVEDAERDGRRAEIQGLAKNSPEFAEAMNLLGADLAKSAFDQLRKGLVEALTAGLPDVKRVLGAEDVILDALSAKKNKDIVGPRLKGAEVKKALTALCSTAAPLVAHVDYAPGGDLEVVAQELEFGESDSDGWSGKRLELELGDKPLAVRGRIDAVVRRLGKSQASGAYRVVDFKTGKTKVEMKPAVASFVQPQLVLYAMALEKLRQSEPEGDTPPRVEMVAYDDVRNLQGPEAPFDDDTRMRARAALGAVLDHARVGAYPPRPHSAVCPIAEDYGAYCDFGDVCRVRSTLATDAFATMEQEEEALGPEASAGEEKVAP